VTRCLGIRGDLDIRVELTKSTYRQSSGLPGEYALTLSARPTPSDARGATRHREHAQQYCRRSAAVLLSERNRRLDARPRHCRAGACGRASAGYESQLAGAREGHLAELLEQVGLRDVRETLLSVSVGHASFEEWWQPFTLGVGPAGDYLATLDEVQRVRLRELCRQTSTSEGVTVTAGAWAARSVA
jgi:hypothetical protein